MGVIKTSTLVGEITYIQDKEIIQLLEGYLKQKSHTGSRSMMAYRSAIFRFFKYLKEELNVTSLQEIYRDTIEKYLEYIDKRLNKLSSKTNQLKYVYSFFEYAVDFFQTHRQSFFNPCPRAKFYRFTPNPPLSIKEERLKTKDQYFTVEELIIILQKARKIDYEKFVQCVLMTFCGMRVSECISIRKENLDIDGRYLKTGIEENCRKSNKNGEKPLYFCFPNQVADILFDYTSYHEKKYGKDERWLFPSSYGVKSFVNVKTLQRFLDTMNLNFNARTHKFRKSLETYQAYKENNVPPHIVELLSCHSITSIVYKHYAQCTLEERRKYYDQYLPKEFQLILKELKKLI
jgi:integrase